MRLLNTRDLKLRYFVGDVPPYVILSHTWGEDEVLFEDINKPEAIHMTGYKKIYNCCQQAKTDGFEWAWIDTCCINKSSSAELSEAINSMYRWYWEAATCYAYLVDIKDPDKRCQPCLHQNTPDSSHRIPCKQHNLEYSLWWTRGWTLQELLAPSVVEFYTSGWQRLGSRTMLVDQIAYVSNIDKQYLLDRRLISKASIATRFSWASSRKTTRPEDMAYCLLGLVGINMPMLYGEGTQSFYRLQLELIKQTNEHTIFSWQISGSPSHRFSSTILAQSPEAFRCSANIRPLALGRQAATQAFEMTNNGLRLVLPCISMNEERMVAILDCENEAGQRIGLWLERSDAGQFQRLPDSELALLKPRDVEEAESLEFYAKANPEPVSGLIDSLLVLWVDSPWSHKPDVAYLVHAHPEGYLSHIEHPKGMLHMHERSFVFYVLSSQLKGLSWDSRRSNFTVVIGQYRGEPTVRAFPSNSYDRLIGSRIAPKRIKWLLEENHKHIRDHYRAQLCCGNFLQVALRRQYRNEQLCWGLKIVIVGRTPHDQEISESYRPPTTCTREMSLDSSRVE